MYPIIMHFKYDSKSHALFQKALSRLKECLNAIAPQIKKYNQKVYLLNLSDIHIPDISQYDFIQYIPKLNCVKEINIGKWINYLALNYAIKYEWFFYLNIDDVISSNFIDMAIKIIQEDSSIKHIAAFCYDMPFEYYSHNFNELKNLYMAKGKETRYEGNVFNTETFLKLRGINEDFIGSSANDTDYNLRAEKIGKVLATKKLECIHLWHPLINRENDKINVDKAIKYRERIKQGELFFNNISWGQI